MRYFIYLISDHLRQHIHAGYCEDLNKLINFYDLLNQHSLACPRENHLNRLVYFEEVAKEGTAIDRVAYFTFLSLSMKQQEISAINPNWDDLTKDINFQHYA